MSIERRCNDADRRKPKYSEKNVPVPLCPPQTPLGLASDSTRASVVRSRRRTAEATVEPHSVYDWVAVRYWLQYHQALWWRNYLLKLR